MKNPNELTLGQMIILENEYNNLFEEIQTLENDLVENGVNQWATYRIKQCESAIDEVAKICRLFGYNIVINEVTHRYALCEK